MKTITFDESAKELVLKVFGKDVDDDGYITEHDTGLRVLNTDGNEVHIKDFAGIRHGSEIFITKDLPSLIEHASDIVKA
jgi:hypothetical protein